MRFRPTIVLSALATLTPLAVGGPGPPDPGPGIVGYAHTPGMFSIDRDALAAALAADGPFVLEGVPCDGIGPADLRVERFHIAGPHTIFTVIDDSGPHPLAFDPESVVLLTGSIDGRTGSHVFLAIADTWGRGRIETGAGGPSVGVRFLGRRGEDPWAAAAARGRPLSAEGAGVSRCGVGPAAPADPKAPPAAPDGPEPIRGLKQVEISIDADFEFYELFNDARRTAEYLTSLYGEVSDIFVRDGRARLDLVQLRIFTTPNDPYGQTVGHPNPPRPPLWDVAQLISGRRDAYAGGEAYLCWSTSWVAYGQGFYTDPSVPNIYNQDLEITAHELGHNLGPLHTHDYGIDQCATAQAPPRRGTILSYCAQTYTGGRSLTDMHFHVRLRQEMALCMARFGGIVHDCNHNRLSDALDISEGRSQDANTNNIPDECEDCNANQRLDSLDISTGFSRDLNANGIPDECEPDCNRNGVPDDKDIADRTSTDAYGNGIPDECEVDCNNNGTSDHTEIQLNMALDKDCNGQLDSCQDCDGDLVSDLAELAGANFMWAADRSDGRIKEYHARVGVQQRASAATVALPQDLLITPDRRVLVSGADTDRVAEFDAAGAFVRDLVAPGSGGLNHPTGLAILGDILLVSSRDTNSVLRYDAATGAFQGVFVSPGSGGLAAPYFIAIGPGGNVYVGSNGTNSVLEYDDQGAFLRVFVAPGAGGLSRPRGLLFLNQPDRFLVVSHGTHRVLQFDALSGAFGRQFNNGDYVGKMRYPWDIARGPDGNVYVSRLNLSDLHLTDPRVFQFDGRNGNLDRAYIQGMDSQLVNPTGIDFMPGAGFDCNNNQFPDTCDISSGRSPDLNHNGVPDECDPCYADCDTGTGVEVLDIFDFLCFQNRYDQGDPYACDCDQSSGTGVCDIFDFLCFQNAYDAGCP